jgi:hypothetical protein
MPKNSVIELSYPERRWLTLAPPDDTGFDRAKVQALPGVAAMSLFAVYYGASVDGLPDANVGFPPATAALFQTVERPVILAGRAANPSQADEAMASPVDGKQVPVVLTAGRMPEGPAASCGRSDSERLVAVEFRHELISSMEASSPIANSGAGQQ